jgi:tRNA modification GTPase
LRATADEIEAEGVRRALARAGSADLKLVLFDAALWPALDETTAAQIDGNSLILLTKYDMSVALLEDPLVAGRSALALSVKTGAGTETLLARLKDLIGERFGAGELPALTRQRHREALRECQEALARAGRAFNPELMAEDLRLAVRALGRITGRVDVEDILDRIFRDFCIGK